MIRVVSTNKRRVISLSLANPRFLGLSVVRCVQTSQPEFGPEKRAPLKSSTSTRALNINFFHHHSQKINCKTPRHTLAPVGESPTASPRTTSPCWLTKSLNPERTHVLASIVAARLGLLGSPADLKTIIVFAARGMLSGNGSASGGFVSLVTGSHGPVATHAS